MTRHDREIGSYQSLIEDFIHKLKFLIELLQWGIHSISLSELLSGVIDHLSIVSLILNGPITTHLNPPAKITLSQTLWVPGGQAFNPRKLHLSSDEIGEIYDQARDEIDEDPKDEVFPSGGLVAWGEDKKVLDQKGNPPGMQVRAKNPEISGEALENITSILEDISEHLTMLKHNPLMKSRFRGFSSSEKCLHKVKLTQQQYHYFCRQRNIVKNSKSNEIP